jgi:hypothetical protein
MHTILLFVHILLALVTLAASAKVVVDARRSTTASSKRDLRVMWMSFISVVVSGTALVILAPSSLGHACALMSLYVVVVSGAHLYQKRVTSLV